MHIMNAMWGYHVFAVVRTVYATGIGATRLDSDSGSPWRMSMCAGTTLLK